MFTETRLLQEFTRLVQRTHPQAGKVLPHCYLKLVTAHWGHPPRRLDYIAIYCPEAWVEKVSSHKSDFRNISHYMGLAEPVFVNASRLLRDPLSKLQQTAPRFWLELQRLVSDDAPESPPE